MLIFGTRYRFVLPFTFCLTACGTDPSDSIAQGGSSQESCDPTQVECPFGTYCKAEDGCGEGVCAEGPKGCNGACDGVCGCDGAYYCNRCVAHWLGVDADELITCAPPPIQRFVKSYGAVATRLVLLQVDFGRDRCVMVTLANTDEPSLPFDVEVSEGWALREIIETDHALDCYAHALGCSAPAPVGLRADAIEARGNIEISMDGAFMLPEYVSADLTLEFDPKALVATDDPFVLENFALVNCL